MSAAGDLARALQARNGSYLARKAPSKPGQTYTPGGAGTSGGGGGGFNPGAYADAQAGSAHDSVLDTLRRQIAQANNNVTGARDSIHTAYAPVTAQAQSNVASGDDYGSKLRDEVTRAATGFSQGIGAGSDQAAGGNVYRTNVAANLAGNLADMAGQQAIIHQQNTQAVSQAGRQEADMGTALESDRQQRLTDLQGKLTDETKQKGTDRAAAYQQGILTKSQLDATNTQTKIEKDLAAGQLAQQRLQTAALAIQNARSKQEMSLARKQFDQAVKQQQFQNDRTTSQDTESHNRFEVQRRAGEASLHWQQRQRVADRKFNQHQLQVKTTEFNKSLNETKREWNAAHPEGGVNAIPPFSQWDAPTRVGLQDRLSTGIKANDDTIKTWQGATEYMNQQLQIMGLDPSDPTVASYVHNIALSTNLPTGAKDDPKKPVKGSKGTPTPHAAGARGGGY